MSFFLACLAGYMVGDFFKTGEPWSLVAAFFGIVGSLCFLHDELA